MKKRYIFLFFFFSIIIVTGVFVFMYIDAVSFDSSVDYVGMDEQEIYENRKISWLDKLKKIKTSKFIYPSSELVAKLDIVHNNNKNINISTFKIPNIDDYKLFCIQQVLSSNQIQYFYSRIDDNLLLSLQTADKALIKKVFQEFIDYGIKGNR